MSDLDVSALLERLHLNRVHPGAWSGSKGWSTATDATAISVKNPATGELMATVRAATAEDYEDIIRSAQAAAAEWREVPAPKRGEAVRLLGAALREHKEDLGTLVSAENGKILAEGQGEVQEMIDITDFAVGQSRHALRPDDAFRARSAPHVRAMASIGRRRHHFRLQLPSGSVGVECLPCGDLWRMPRYGSPRPKTPLTALAVQQLCNRVHDRHARLPPIFNQVFVDAGTELGHTASLDDRRVALI
jgi:aldehyde dehydrogenase (NAD+)